MAKNTAVAADANAPPITRILAEFVSTHRSRGWSDAVDAEAHRTVLNWMGCAIGASHHPTAEAALAAGPLGRVLTGMACAIGAWHHPPGEAALAAVAELSPAPQATVLGRRERVDIANAAFVNGVPSHTFDFDDTHLRTIIHPAG